MKLEDAITFGRRSIFACLVLASLITGSSAIPATADPHTTPFSAHVAPPAVPGIPDAGQPGEDTGQQTEPTIDPQGNPVWPTKNNHNVAPRGGWTAVVGVVDGARIRTTPVTGTIVGLIPYNAYYGISCRTRALDGTVWGYAMHEGRYGWVRSDLWEIVRFTAPHAPSPRPIPWC